MRRNNTAFKQSVKQPRHLHVTFSGPGALFDQNDHPTHTAFRYAVEYHNNVSGVSGVQLQAIEKLVDSNNCYQVQREMCRIMKEGVFAFFESRNHDVTKSLRQRFHMPHISSAAHPATTSSPPSRETSYVLHIRPNINEAVGQLVLHYKWSHLFYLYNSDDEFESLQILYQIVQNSSYHKVVIEAVKVKNIERCHNLLRYLDQREVPNNDRHFLLNFKTNREIALLLSQFQQLGMNRHGYHYLIASLAVDELELDDFLHGGVNITGLRFMDPDNRLVLKHRKAWKKLPPRKWKAVGPMQKLTLEAALVLDSVSVVARGIRKMLERNRKVFQDVIRRGHIYNNGTRGIDCNREKILPWTKGPELLHSFSQLNFQGLTGQLSFDRKGLRKDITLSVLEQSLNHRLRVVGDWSKKKGLNVKRVVEVAPPPKPEKNNTRIVTTIISYPYLMEREQPDDGAPLVGNDRYEGFAADLAKHLSEIVGFDYILKLVADNKYGMKMNNGKWNGMVGELTERKAQLAIAPLTISSIRQRVVHFSKPFMSLGISIMIKKPEKLKPGVFSFMDPLSKEIWMCIIVSYFTVSISLFIVSRFSPSEFTLDQTMSGPSFANNFTVLNSLWFSLAAFMQQGCELSPRSLSGRIVGSVWWFFTLIIISSYTANLAAFLTVERMLTPIDSADDLAKQTVIQYGTLDAGSTKTFFETSKIAVYQRMAEFMRDAKPSVFVDTTEKGVERVRNSKGKYAFLLESTMNEFYNQRKPCNTIKVGGHLDSKGYGVATPLGSELREPINLAVLKLRENGVLQKLHKKWWYDKGECGHENEGKKYSHMMQGSKVGSSLALSNVAGIFYILIGGLGLAMLMSFLEFFCKSRSDQNKQKLALSKTVRLQAAALRERFVENHVPNYDYHKGYPLEVPANGAYMYLTPPNDGMKLRQVGLIRNDSHESRDSQNSCDTHTEV